MSERSDEHLDARIDCEDAFHTINDGLAALRLIWDQVAHGSSHDDEALQRALHFTLKPMEQAAKELGHKLRVVS
jgi:hypothetical protein